MALNHDNGLRSFRVTDFWRFRKELWACPEFSEDLRSYEFRKLLKDRFGIEATVNPHDPRGKFWLDDRQAMMFVLKWQ